jgi:hypothetical protein
MTAKQCRVLTAQDHAGCRPRTQLWEGHSICLHQVINSLFKLLQAETTIYHLNTKTMGEAHAVTPRESTFRGL